MLTNDSGRSKLDRFTEEQGFGFLRKKIAKLFSLVKGGKYREAREELAHLENELLNFTDRNSKETILDFNERKYKFFLEVILQKISEQQIDENSKLNQYIVDKRNEYKSKLQEVKHIRRFGD